MSDIDMTRLLQAVTAQDATQRQVAEQQAATIKLLRELNGRVRRNTEDVVALQTWRTDHEARHQRLDGEMDDLRRRNNIIGMLNATLTAIAGAVVAFLRH